MSEIFVMVNPWAIPWCEEILSDINEHGRQLRRARVPAVPESIARDHYSHKAGEPYFEPMIRGLAGQSVEIAIYGGDVIEFNALKPVIRGRYDPRFLPAHDFLRRAVHISDSDEAAAKEIGLWKGFFD
jgi:nucleoside diphosphate kinase